MTWTRSDAFINGLSAVACGRGKATREAAMASAVEDANFFEKAAASSKSVFIRVFLAAALADAVVSDFST
jgi:hypothetical protein